MRGDDTKTDRAMQEYRSINGSSVPDEGIRIERLPEDIETIVLASDGYPYLNDTLQASERALQEVLHDDPLLFRKYRATKGMHQGWRSFDDRAYVRLRIRA